MSLSNSSSLTRYIERKYHFTYLGNHNLTRFRMCLFGSCVRSTDDMEVQKLPSTVVHSSMMELKSNDSTDEKHIVVTMNNKPNTSGSNRGYSLGLLPSSNRGNRRRRRKHSLSSQKSSTTVSPVIKRLPLRNMTDYNSGKTDLETEKVPETYLESPEKRFNNQVKVPSKQQQDPNVKRIDTDTTERRRSPTITESDKQNILDDIFRCVSNDDDDDKNALNNNKNSVYVRDDFVFGRKLGQGGFAICQKVTSKKDESKVLAIKIIRKSDMKRSYQWENLRNEIKVHRLLSMHPNVVHFEGSFHDEYNIYILMQLCDRQTLADLLVMKGRLPEQMIKYLMRQILEGLSFLHDQNVIHHDIKPSNLYLHSDGTVKIGDFGFACKLSHKDQKIRNVCGTPNYVCPEIILDRDGSSSSSYFPRNGHGLEADIWSVGCVMYCLLVGHAPFETRSVERTYEKILRKDYSFPESILPDTSVECLHLIRELLQYIPYARPTAKGALNHSFFFVSSCSREDTTSDTNSDVESLSFDDSFYRLSLATDTTTTTRKTTQEPTMTKDTIVPTITDDIT